MRAEFEFHLLNETGKARAQAIAEQFDQLTANLEALVPPGRYLSLTKTKLEEACFFAKKGMACDPSSTVTP